MRFDLLFKPILFISIVSFLRISVSQDTKAIEITKLPEWGTLDSLHGHVIDINPTDYKVAVYVSTGTWWNKRNWDDPLTDIQEDGTWTCHVWTRNATCMAAFLVPNDFIAPRMDNDPILPDSLFKYPHDMGCRLPGNRKIIFSGYSWTVKQTEEKAGPGPNFFSDEVNDVWVHESGDLHMSIIRKDDQWFCTEVMSDSSFGYGTYTFILKSNASSIDKNAILGLFTYDKCPYSKNHQDYGKNYPGMKNTFREIDIEFSKWGESDNSNSQFVIQPWSQQGNIFRFDTKSDQITTHKFTWTKDSICFYSYYGESDPEPSDLITSWKYTGDHIPLPGNEIPRINFWLLDGIAPSTGEKQEAILKHFKFESENTSSIKKKNNKALGTIECYPNPFFERTEIEYELKQTGIAEINIFDVFGKKVKSLYSGYQEHGSHSVIWKGENEHGERVGIGVYYFSIKEVGTNQTRTLLKIGI